MLDSTYSVETPEGSELPILPAGLIVRGLAFSIDLLIRVMFYIVFTALTGILTPGAQTGLILIVIFLLEWFYPVVFEVLRDGATPGKKMFNLKVIKDSGLPVDFMSSLTRNLLILADFMPSFFTSGIISMTLNSHSKRLGDLAAGTLVIHIENNKKQPFLSEDKTIRSLPFPMNRSEQNALVNFAERRSRLSDARAEELASILKPILTEHNTPAELQILQMANGVMGR